MEQTVRLLPRDERFFELFTAVTTLTLNAARQLREMLEAEPGQRAHLIDQIKRAEHEADELTMEVVTRLHRSFITPLDREDIHLLASHLDDIIDIIDGTARRAAIFQIGTSPRGVTLMAGVIERAMAELLTAVKELESGRRDRLSPSCQAVKKLEEEGDAVYHEWLARLFDDSEDALTILKWKEIYDNLERTLDQIEDAANILQSISIKNS